MEYSKPSHVCDKKHYSDIAPLFAESLPIFTAERLCLSKVLFLYPIKLSVNLISRFFLVPPTFSAFRCCYQIHDELIFIF